MAGALRMIAAGGRGRRDATSSARIAFGSKAETLERLRGVVTTAEVLPQLRFTVAQWSGGGRRLDAVCESRPDWFAGPVIVRSSGVSEDTELSSLAGHFESVGGVRGEAAIAQAIERVLDSFGGRDGRDQVFIQPMLEAVALSGVVFSRDPSTGGHYDVINLDRHSGRTDTVTSGRTNALETVYVFKGTAIRDDTLAPVVALLRELEALFEHDALDVEFAVSAERCLTLLQVRRLVLPEQSRAPGRDTQAEALALARRKFTSLSGPHPYLLGQRSVFGNMPDWNPAEVIGVRPRPLALSLYKELLTDSIWAYQRDNYGYRKLRSFPLLVSFAGLPYIDVRVSFNSFIPASLEESLATRLVEHYLSRLVADPSRQDKVEFDIIYSCYTLDLPERVEALGMAGFLPEERQAVCDSLRELTNRVVHDETGLWRRDIEKIAELEQRHRTVSESDLDLVEKIYWLMEDCKRYGTLPFAGLARAGFIAVQMLKSLVAKGVFSPQEYDEFMRSLDTVSSRIGHDFLALDRETFLRKYGHLRPGTYDLSSPRYDETPDQYFDWTRRERADASESPRAFSLSLGKLNVLESLLKEHRLEHNVLTLLNFIKGAIEGREYAKFVFTRSLSDVLRLMEELGQQHGLTVDDMSYVNVDCIRQLYSSSSAPRDLLASSTQQGRAAFRLTESIVLPPVLREADEFWAFVMPGIEPNFVTLRRAQGPVIFEDSPREQLPRAIMLIPSADPGYDWIFSHEIAGFVTMYGGVNSHMAIRAGEMGIPAVVGAGEALYDEWSRAEVLEIDCAARQVRRIR